MLTCHPVIFNDGAARPVAPSLWKGLFARGASFPELAGRRAHVALAYVRTRDDGRRGLVSLQCMRVHFDARGVPVTFNMSLVRLAGECPLGEDARPVPRRTKFSQEPHYWFPDERELARIARALAPRPAPSPLIRLLHAPPAPARIPPLVHPPLAVRREHRIEG